MGDHPLLLEWHGSAMVSRSVWEFVEGFLEGISRLLGFGTSYFGEVSSNGRGPLLLECCGSAQ